MALHLTEIAVDCADPGALAAFWCAALAYEVVGTEEGLVTVGPPDGSGPVLTFAVVPEPKTVKNRLHLDLRPDDQAAEVARLEGLGARRTDVGQRPEEPWVVLLDPEGNEFCVLAAR